MKIILDLEIVSKVTTLGQVYTSHSLTRKVIDIVAVQIS